MAKVVEIKRFEDGRFMAFIVDPTDGQNVFVGCYNNCDEAFSEGAKAYKRMMEIILN